MPRAGRPPIPVAFTIGMGVRDGLQRPPWVFATYEAGGLGNLVELLHESGHAIHGAGIRTRPAFLEWTAADTAFLEGTADILGWDATEPDWQRHWLGEAATAREALLDRYGAVMLDVAWALFELELHRDPRRRPNDVWTAITSDGLGIEPHPEWSWWAMRGQLIESPGLHGELRVVGHRRRSRPAADARGARVVADRRPGLVHLHVRTTVPPGRISGARRICSRHSWAGHSPSSHSSPTSDGAGRGRIRPRGVAPRRVGYRVCRRSTMSEAGWRAFLAADGVDDWVVLHGGATAVFRVGSLDEAARLAEAMSQVAGLEGSGAVLTIAAAHLTVRLTRDLWMLEPQHADLARAVSAVARAHGAIADRAAVQEVQLAIAAKPDVLDVGFWRAVLGYAPMSDDNGVDPLGHGSTVWMQELEPAKLLRHAMHIDVSVAREHAEARLAAALAAGGRIVEGSNAPASWILADRAGNRVCIAAWPDGATESTPDEPA